VRRALALGALLLTLSGCAVVSDALGPGETIVFDISVGECLNDAAETGDVSTVPVVDCDKPHDSEVYAVIVMDDAEYPGDQAVVRRADEECRAEFESFIGVPAAESRYMFNALYPTENSWNGGDREILCRVALVADGEIQKVSGSLRDAGE
jgi:hypothetical protein